MTLSSEGMVRTWAHPTGEFPNPLSNDRHLQQPEIWGRLEARARIIGGIRAFFQHHQFLEVETPLVVPSPGTEVHLAPTSVLQSERPGATQVQRYLITSPEYHMKRLLAAGSPPIFQLCKTFRDGERGTHHRPEFTMLEWYRPWATLHTILEDCEDLLKALHPADSLTYRGENIALSGPWPRHPFLRLLSERAGINEPERLNPDEQLTAFVAHVEPRLGRGRPEFVTEYPISMASLARPCPTDPAVAERSELYVAGMEIANAFGELVDADEQRQRCEADNIDRRELGLPELPLDEDFLDSLTQGLPPSGGIALGVDRLIMLLTDSETIDEVICF
ncbi:MAG: EF-P lysine aminoacylase EpmA [Myxococcota bacterium]